MTRSRLTFLTAIATGTAAIAVPRIALTQTTKLRVATVAADSFAEPFFVAAAGAFAKIGYEVAVVNVPSGPAAAAALAGGAVDFGIIDLISSVTAILKGVPLQLIAGGALYRASEPTAIAAVAKDGPIRVPRDLEGHTMALPVVGGLALAATRAWLRQGGADPSKVNFIEFQESGVTAALARGTFDAGFLNEPFRAYARSERADIRDIGHPLDSVAKDYLTNCWFAQKGWIEQDRDRAHRVVAAIYETARWANAHRPQTLTILARVSALESDKLHGMVRVGYATTLTPALIQPVLDIGVESKLLPQQVDSNTLITQV